MKTEFDASKDGCKFSTKLNCETFQVVVGSIFCEGEWGRGCQPRTVLRKKCRKVSNSVTSQFLVESPVKQGKRPVLPLGCLDMMHL